MRTASPRWRRWCYAPRSPAIRSNPERVGEPWHAPLGLAIVARSLQDANLEHAFVHANVLLYARLRQRLGPLAAKLFENGRLGELVSADLLNDAASGHE